MNWVTVKESHYPSELAVLKSRLESEGIECFLKNELTTQVFSHLATFVVELQVKESDLERVMEIIKESGELE